MTKLALALASFFTKILPFRVLTSVVWYILIFRGYRRQVINKNYISTSLTKNYAGSTSSFYKKNIRYLARLIAEIARPMTPSNIHTVTYSGTEHLTRLANRNKGVIILASHYGNWEAACSLLPLHTDLPCYGVYKPLKNTTVDHFLLQRRSAHGLNLVPMKRIGRVITENLRAGRPAAYILIADQNPNSKHAIIWQTFLGIRTAFFSGPSKLLDKYGFAAMYMRAVVHDQPYQYDIHLSPMDTSREDSDITRQYADLLEKQITQQPEFWLWSHKRWKRNF